MKTQHTPGPWEISRDAVPEGYVQTTVYDPTGKRVATVFESEGNVNLIAAAPELLEALLILRNSTAVLNHLDKDHIDLIESAIAKAERAI